MNDSHESNQYLPGIIRKALTRRTFLIRTAVLVGGAAVPALAGEWHAAAADAAVVLPGVGATLSADASGNVTVLDANGTARVLLGSLWLNPQGSPTGGTASLVTLSDGTQALQVNYTDLTYNGNTYQFQGTFWFAGPGHIHIHHDIQGNNIWAPGIMMNRQYEPITNTLTDTAPPNGIPVAWTYDPRGGIPFETPLSEVFSNTWSDGYASQFVIPGSNPDWRDPWKVNAPGTAVGTSTTHFTVDVDLFVGKTQRPNAAASLAAGKPVAVELWSDQPYNLWNNFASPLTIHTESLNGGSSAATIQLSWTVRTWDGILAASGRASQQVGATQTWDHDIVLNLSGYSSQRILFLEVQATTGQNTALSRTNLVAMAPHQFVTGEQSMIGLGGFFLPHTGVLPQPGELELAQRIGVKWLRSPDFTAPSTFFTTNQPTNNGVDLTTTPDQNWFTTLDTAIQTYHALNIELFNELNFPALQNNVPPGSTAVANYVNNWLKPVRQHLQAMFPNVTLATMGVGGMDYTWVDQFIADGGWNLIDGLAIHPGRGNFTADYAPPPDQWVPGPTGSYWNYYGALKKARETIDQHGQRDLWLTECYTLDFPNHWWNDTFRHAAENTMLELFLAVEKGVTHVLWYQFHNGVWWDPTGISTTDREYHFGLLNHDLSPKPSLLAFETVARLLDDGTKFKRWLNLGDADLRGMEFSGPTGGFVVLWSRKDGYILNANHGSSDWYPFPEVWVDPWQTKTQVHLHAGKAGVQEIDCIGRESVIQTHPGMVKITLDGAPRVYTGLDTTKIPTGQEPPYNT